MSLQRFTVLHLHFAEYVPAFRIGQLTRHSPSYSPIAAYFGLGWFYLKQNIRLVSTDIIIMLIYIAHNWIKTELYQCIQSSNYWRGRGFIVDEERVVQELMEKSHAL